jgi:hypothetical protein
VAYITWILPDVKRSHQILGLLGFLAMTCLVLGTTPQPAHAQSTVRIIPGSHYDRGETHRDLFGSDYRDLWTTSIEVEVLDLDRAAEGLRPFRRGGGRQTTSLRFVDRDGKEYSFRSVDKVPAFAVHPDLEGTLSARLLQDQVSSLVPGAPVVAASLTGAAGILRPRPRMVVMPDDPRLGDFREEFAGMLGTFEEHVDEAEDGGPGFEEFTTIAATETLLDHLEESPEHRADSRTYLAARLVDLVLGDWDRHEDQWRWVRIDRPQGYLWTPVPRDRDYALADYDGKLLGVVRRFVPNAVRFDERIADLDGLLYNARNLDRRVLADLGRPAWDSVAAEVQALLTDEKIDAAVGALPPEFFALRGVELASTLKSRRDHLPTAAVAFYGRMAAAPVIRTTDEDEVAELIRHEDGAVEVSITTDSGEPYFRRTFHPDETTEVRVYLQGGNDRASLRGEARLPITVRIVGGGGTDTLVDSSTVASPGRWTSLHDSGDDDRLLGGPQTTITRAEYVEPVSDRLGLVRLQVDDEPDVSTSVTPTGDYSTTTGVVVGGRFRVTERAFRRHPFATRTTFELLYAPRWSSFGASARTEFRGFDPHRHGEISVTASGIDALRFYGFGNETTRDLPSSFYRLRRDLYEFELTGVQRIGRAVVISGGVVARHSRPRPVSGSPLAAGVLGSDRFTSLGVHTALTFERGSSDSTATMFHAAVQASAHPLVSAGEDPFGKIGGSVAASIPMGSSEVRTVVRGGGELAWGSYPFFEAAFLGGSDSLRGYPSWRFAGDGMVHGSAEVVAPIGRLPFIMNWRTYGHLFTDLGRVFLSGERSSKWHYAPGAGLTFSALDYHIKVSYAYGTKSRLYLDIGVPAGSPR